MNALTLQPRATLCGRRRRRVPPACPLRSLLPHYIPFTPAPPHLTSAP